MGKKFMSIKRTKKIYESPQLHFHGKLSEITKGSIPTPNATDDFGCS